MESGVPGGSFKRMLLRRWHLNTDLQEVRSETMWIWGRGLFLGRRNIRCKPWGRDGWGCSGSHREARERGVEGWGEQQETSERPVSLHGAESTGLFLWVRWEVGTALKLSCDVIWLSLQAQWWWIRANKGGEEAGWEAHSGPVKGWGWFGVDRANQP